MRKLIFSLIFFTSCGIDSGYIVNKKFIPEHREGRIRMQPSGKTLIPINYTEHYDNQYIFIIKDKNRTKKVTVSKALYLKYNVGEWYKNKTK
jgi:hypothetical protein